MKVVVAARLILTMSGNTPYQAMPMFGFYWMPELCVRSVAHRTKVELMLWAGEDKRL